MSKAVLFTLGVLALIPYLAAWWLGDLRQQTLGFEILFFVAFGLYAGATIVTLRLKKSLITKELLVIFALAMAMQGVLVFTRPTLSDDMYRYIWEARIQAHGYSPYRYPPTAPMLLPLRDQKVWPFINRKNSVTIYPPAAQMSFLALWRLWPDSVRWFQIAIATGGLLTGVLLIGLLRALNLSPARVVLYLWSPLLAFETAHAAHMDGLVLPFLVGAWWARVKEKDTLVGILLGLATALKFYPALLFPALWRPSHRQGRWRMPVAFLLTLLLTYIPYLFIYGAEIVGFWPKYLREHFNVSPLVKLLFSFFDLLKADPLQSVTFLLLAILAITALTITFYPAKDGYQALRRCIWLIGPLVLLSYNLFSWYLLWLLPLLAVFVQPDARFGLRLDGWSGWWLLSGLVALSYTFFLDWQPLPWAIWVQFLPLYLFLLVGLIGRWQLFHPVVAGKERAISKV
jgi:hypothetical protein